MWDHHRVAAAFADCLHIELLPEIIGEEQIALTPPDLRAFLNLARRQRHYTEDFIARAEHFLALADQEMSA